MPEPSPSSFHSHSAEETVAHGAKFTAKIKKTPVLILLNGPLGAGKTQWAKGFVSAFLKKEILVASPSYSIVNSYENKNRRVHHVDLYRLEGADDLESIGFWDLLSQPCAVIVEWGKKLPFPRPEEVAAWNVEFELISESERLIKISPL